MHWTKNNKVQQPFQHFFGYFGQEILWLFWACFRHFEPTFAIWDIPNYTIFTVRNGHKKSGISQDSPLERQYIAISLLFTVFYVMSPQTEKMWPSNKAILVRPSTLKIQFLVWLYCFNISMLICIFSPTYNGANPGFVAWFCFQYPVYSNADKRMKIKSNI